MRLVDPGDIKGLYTLHVTYQKHEARLAVQFQVFLLGRLDSLQIGSYNPMQKNVILKLD